MTDILTNAEVDAIDRAAHEGEHTDGDLAALIRSNRAQAAKIEEQDAELEAIAHDVQDRVKFYEKEASIQDDDDEREGYEEYATLWRRFAFKHELMEPDND